MSSFQLFAWPISSVAVSSSTSSSDMKRFMLHIVFFSVVLGGLLCGACFFLPDATAKKTMLGAQISKLKRLQELPGERVIIVGGSGCGQGFVTSNLCAALARPVYNMGLHAGLGLIYQMKAVEPFVRKGDTVLLIPEYANFDGTSCFGEAELLMMVIDIIPEHKSLLSFRHWLHLLPMVPKYGADKLRHLFMPPCSTDRSDDFDSYGDEIYPISRPPLARIPFPVAKSISADVFSDAVIGDIKRFCSSVCSKGGNIYLYPPAFQSSSHKRQKAYIDRIEEVVKRAGLPFSASTSRYVMDDKYFYDTPYHLNLSGRKKHGELLAEDLSGIFSK